ncbi:hypothetical protein XBI1_1090049 [Xenorhabdus bovienii str. Intermedium]|uniref:Uncharacterized protein n=1 Tax=Xenorhabdus bovienii str. Intermedium TaxID=1379677 RepID=A0A077QBQ8_XENBV|nr:hypothetical protein XBI1_1090049 [Xenorhabdus bovienii str. Intermedium]
MQLRAVYLTREFITAVNVVKNYIELVSRRAVGVAVIRNSSHKIH